MLEHITCNKLALAVLAIVLVLASASASEAAELRVFVQMYTPGVPLGETGKTLGQFARIARDFEKLHPGVKVSFIRNPAGDYRTWMLTQLKGGTAPDIVYAPSLWVNDYCKYGWFVNLDPYLAEPNPYVKGNSRWFSTFRADMTDRNRAANGHLYSLPLDLVATGIYYNKHVFKKLNLSVPRTWEEFLSLQQRLKDEGYLPFVMVGGSDCYYLWLRMCFLEQLYTSEVEKMDVADWRLSSKGMVDPQEFVRAYKKGIFKVDSPRYRSMLRLIKGWSKHWQPGFYSTTDSRLFITGKAAMMWDGSWITTQLTHDKMRKFEFGVFPLPYFTPRTSPFATAGVVRGPGGATSLELGIPSTTKQNGKLDLAIDFLRFTTAARNLGPLVSEAEMFVPNAHNLNAHPILEPFKATMRGGLCRFAGEMTTPEYDDRWKRIIQNYIGGIYTEDQAIDRLSHYLAISVEQTLKDNATQWKWGPNWEILPTDPNTDEAIVAKPAPEGPVFFGFVMAIAGVIVVGICMALLRMRRVRAGRVRKSWCYTFLVPTFVLLLLFCYYPAFSAFYHSLYEWKGSGQAIWAGFSNYRDMLSDKILWDSCINMLKFLAFGLVVGLTVPLLVAELVHKLKSDRAKYVFRVLFVVPMVVPVIVTLLIWQFIYEPNIGVLNALLSAVGLGYLKQAWLADPKFALWSLACIGFPWVSGFSLLIYYAGLQNIPDSVFEAAKLDGASGLSRFFAVDLPLLSGQIKLLTIMTFIGGIQGFQNSLILTRGGPGYSTMVPGLHLYDNAIVFDRMGYACAMGVVMFAVIMGLTYLNTKYLKSGHEVGG